MGFPLAYVDFDAVARRVVTKLFAVADGRREVGTSQLLIRTIGPVFVPDRDISKPGKKSRERNQ